MAADPPGVAAAPAAASGSTPRRTGSSPGPPATVLSTETRTGNPGSNPGRHSRLMSTMSAVELVQRHGGVAATATLRAAGISGSDLTDAVRERRLLRPRAGVYALPDTARSVLEALSHCGRIACVTAARAFGLWVLDEDDHDGGDGAGHARIHTWVSAENRPTRVAVHPDPDATTCCVFHRDAPIDEPALTSVGILHCLVQLLRCRGEETFFAALESALRQGLVGPDDLERLRRHLPLRHHWLLDFARSDADSGLESLLRLRLRRHGLSLDGQERIPGVGTREVEQPVMTEW